MVNLLIFPSSFFDTQAVDEDMALEYFAATDTGLYDTVLFNYEAWFHKGSLKLSKKIIAPVTAAYRGWMMLPEQYELFYDALASRGIHLITAPQEYCLMHVFPNIYPQIEHDTAKILIFPEGTSVDVESAKRVFPRFMVKDYVKSVKGTEFPRYFDQNVTQREFNEWLQVFYNYRGSLFTGGICLKEYLPLKQYDGLPNEYRVFYINHEIATVTRNSGQQPYTPMPEQGLIEKYRYLSSPFYTIDFAELEDGTWKILETGDGEVSGLSDDQDYAAFFRALFYCFS